MVKSGEYTVRSIWESLPVNPMSYWRLWQAISTEDELTDWELIQTLAWLDISLIARALIPSSIPVGYTYSATSLFYHFRGSPLGAVAPLSFAGVLLPTIRQIFPQEVVID